MSSIENVLPSNAISAGNRDKEETLLRRNAVLDSWPLHYSRSLGNRIVSTFLYLFSLLFFFFSFFFFFSSFQFSSWEQLGTVLKLPTVWAQEIVFIIDRYILEIASGKCVCLSRNTTSADCNRIIITSTTISEPTYDLSNVDVARISYIAR